MTNRNFKNYWDKYREIYSFEEFSAIYREIELLKSVSLKKKHILELGCGYRPLFLALQGFTSYLAVEPGKDPFNEVLNKSKKFKNVHVINSTFEEWCLENSKDKVDLKNDREELKKKFDNKKIYLEYLNFYESLLIN